MIKFITDAALIMLIICFIIDFSGVTTSLKKTLWRLANGKMPYKHFSIPLIDCSLCVTFHSIWIYGLIIDIPVLYSFAIASGFAFLSGLATKLLDFIFNTIYSFLTK